MTTSLNTVGALSALKDAEFLRGAEYAKLALEHSRAIVLEGSDSDLISLFGSRLAKLVEVELSPQMVGFMATLGVFCGMAMDGCVIPPDEAVNIALGRSSINIEE